jgi:predicted alpha/beta-hydrolase family hydrolase
MKRARSRDTFTIAVGDAETTGTRYRASRARATLVLAHGAGAGQSHPFLVHFATELAARGIDVVTFDFVYMARGRRAPDANAALEACWRAVIDAVRPDAREPLFLGGKSMGGRIATQVAAGDTRGPIGGVVCLGYPLHPPGDPKKLRVAHLPDVAARVLFCQGERDAFGTPAEVRRYAKKMRAATVIAIAGDHSFGARGGAAAQREVYARVIDAIVAWVDA